MRKKGLSLLFALVLYGVFAVRAEATTILTYQDTSLATSPTETVFYTLSFISDGTPTGYNATFLIGNSINSSPEWYAGWFIFKFNTGSTAASLSLLGGPSGPWSIANGGDTTEVLAGGNTYNMLLPRGGFTGFYATNLAKTSPAPDGPTMEGIIQTDAIPLTGNPANGPYLFSFHFDTNGGTVAASSMAFQVGEYDGLNGAGKVVTGQLSQTLISNNPIPEPSTLILFVSGMVGLAMTRLWKLKNPTINDGDSSR